MEKSKIIGLCGRSGSGKGWVSDILKTYGAFHIDTDAVYHELTRPTENGLSECTSELASEFGNDILTDEGGLDRKKLGAMVFSDREKLERLNEITHKHIKKKTLELLDECTATFAVVDAPVLFESGFDALCGVTLCVTASDETCIRRIKRRDGVSDDTAKRRLASQISPEVLREKCSFEIVNDHGRDVEGDVRRFLTAAGIIGDSIKNNQIT